MPAVLRWAQSLPYVPDPSHLNAAGKDLACDVAAVARIGGDCEDLACLVMACALALGLEARLVWLVSGGDLDHVVAEVFDGVRWLWCEATIAGAVVGEHPYRAAARLGAREGIVT